MKSFASLLLLAAACTTEPKAPEGDPVTSFVERREIPLGMNAKLDLLFVIDSSPAMATAQQKLDGDLRAAAAALSSPGFTPDVHVGVITMDAADQGRLRNGAVLAESTRFAWQHEANFDGALPDAVAPLAAVGTGGSSTRQPLDAVLRALAPGANGGFLRDEAYLLVVFVTTGDDASTTSPADAARVLKGLKTDPAKVVVSGAFGACDANGITSAAAPRLDAFFQQFPNRSQQSPLCTPDLVLTAITKSLYTTTLGIACIENIADPTRIDARLVDPETDETLLYRACSSPTDTHCYSLEPHAGCWPDGSLAVVPRPWRTPFPALATLEFETR